MIPRLGESGAEAIKFRLELSDGRAVITEYYPSGPINGFDERYIDLQGRHQVRRHRGGGFTARWDLDGNRLRFSEVGGAARRQVRLGPHLDQDRVTVAARHVRGVPAGYPVEREATMLAGCAVTAAGAVPRSSGRQPSRTPISDHFRCAWKWSPEPLRKQRNRAAARILKPSAGLEPATPSLPWRSRLFTQPRTTSKVPGFAPKWRSATPAAQSIVRHPPLPTGYPAEPSPVRRRRPC